MTLGLFCLSGVGTYDDRRNLEWVPDEIRSMRAALTRLGLTEVAGFKESERSHDVLAKELSNWAKSDPSAQDETLLIYCTGHGEQTDGRYRLLLADDVFDPQRLVEALGARASLRQVVVILDTCFSEPGIDDVHREMRLPNSRTTAIDFWGVASARRIEEASQRGFVRHFSAALARHSAPSWTDSHIELEVVVREVDVALGGKQTVWLAAGHSAGTCRVLPNPRHQRREPPLGLPIPPDWAAKARGVSDASRPGFFFTGRERALTALRAHSEADGETSTLVVTGRRGAGKSALLGHFVLTAAGTDALPTDVRLRWPALPVEIIAGRGERRAVLGALARRLGVAEPGLDAVISALSVRDGRVVVVLDGLDDDDVWDDLLTALAGTPGVRLVLALPTSTDVRAPSHRILDLDAYGDYPDEDVRAYLALRLALTENSAGQNELAGRWGLTFDVARAAADGYANASHHDERKARADHQAAAAARAACRADMADDLGAQAAGVVDALWALCSYDEAIALPASVWAAAVSDPAGVAVTAQEVESAAARSDRFIEPRPSETGLARWRPRLCFTEPPGPAPQNRSGIGHREQFLIRLLELAARQDTDWGAIDPAVRTLIAFGASIQRQDGRLLDKPWFLLDVPPVVVQEAVRKLDGSDRQRHSRLLPALSSNETRADRMLLLEVAARRYAVGPVVRALALDEQAHVVHWVQPDRPRLERLTRLVTCSDTIAVTMDTQDTLHFWDVGDGSPTRPPTRLPGVPWGVSVASVAGEELALVTSREGEVWSLRCRGDEEPRHRSELLVRSGGRLRDLAAVLHSSGQAILGSGRVLWTADSTAGRVRRVFAVDSDLHSLHGADSASGPIAWCVTKAGRVRRLRSDAPRGSDVTPFPLSRSPLFTAASPDGQCLVVMDVAGGLHLRGAHGAHDPLAGVRVRDARAIAVANRVVAVACETPRGLGQVELHDLMGVRPSVRVPVDEAPVGVALPGDGRVLLALPSGLLSLMLHVSDAEVPASTTTQGSSS